MQMQTQYQIRSARLAQLKAELRHRNEILLSTHWTYRYNQHPGNRIDLQRAAIAVQTTLLKLATHRRRLGAL